MKFHKWGQLLIIGVVTSIAGCRYEAVDANADVVDYIIRGDARGAAKCCSFPLDLNRVSPLISIDNEKDFIRLFPIVFDKATRLEIAEKKKGAEIFGLRSVTQAVLAHILLFALVWLLALPLREKTTVVPIDLTLVVHENLDGNENELPPLDDPPPPPPPQPAPPKVSPPPPPPPPVRNDHYR